MHRIAVYTAVFGGYEGAIPQPAQEGVDYIRFTDEPVGARGWEERIVERRLGDPVREARRYKVLAHEFLPGYDVSVWMDANYLVIGDIRSLAAERLSNAPMAVFDHAATRSDPRRCVFDEYESIMEMGHAAGRLKDDPDLMRAQIERYRAEGYPDHNGLTFTAVLLRRHNDPAVVRTMERWWSEIERGSRRDQLSIDYAAWREGLELERIGEDLRSCPWFEMIAHHRRSYALPLLRRRIRATLGIRKRR